MGFRLLDLNVCACFGALLKHLCNEIIREFSFEFRRACKKARLFYYTISFQNISFLPKAITIGKLEAAKPVTSPYQENARPNISGRKLVKLILLITVKPP